MSVNNSGRFFKISKQSYAEAEGDYLQYMAMPSGCHLPQDSQNLDKLRKGAVIFDNCCVCEVFAAIFVEAAVNSIGELGLGKGYFGEHLEKLDPKSKIVLVMRLIDNEELDKSGEYYACLTHLFRVRNDTVHHKTKPDDKHIVDPNVPMQSAKKCLKAALLTGSWILRRKRLPLMYGPDVYNYDFRI